MLTIRDARREDLPAIVALLADDPLGAARETVAVAVAEPYVRAFEAIERDANNRMVVATDARAGAQGASPVVVGCLQLTFIPGLSRRGATRAQIESVRVASTRRGQGLGQVLMAWAIMQARERGCAIVQLTSDKQRADAHRFYESLGFVATHEGFKLNLDG